MARNRKWREKKNGAGKRKICSGNESLRDPSIHIPAPLSLSPEMQAPRGLHLGGHQRCQTVAKCTLAPSFKSINCFLNK